MRIEYRVSVLRFVLDWKDWQFASLLLGCSEPVEVADSGCANDH